MAPGDRGGDTAAKRETDLLGWFEQHSAVGVVLTEIETLDPSVAREIAGRVRRELGKRLGTDTASDYDNSILIEIGSRRFVERL